MTGWHYLRDPNHGTFRISSRPPRYRPNVNYCVAAFAIILVISTIQRFVHGRKNFTGPKADLDALEHSLVLEMTGELVDYR